MREEGYTPHIATPNPPEWVAGDRAGLEAALKAYQEGFRDSRGHQLRKDGQLLRADVVSCPPGTTDSERKKIEALTIDYYKKKFGPAFRGAVRHVDEPFRDKEYSDQTHHHLHLFIVPEVKQKFEDIHAGLKAKRQADRVNRAASKEEKTQAKAHGTAAYKEAMKKEQDEFFKAVGQPCGLIRLGPQRPRVNKQAQHVVNEAKKEAGKILDTAESQAKGIKNDAYRDADSIRNKADKEKEDALNKRLLEIQKKERELKKREAQADDFEEAKKLPLAEGILKPKILETAQGYVDRCWGYLAGWLEKAKHAFEEYTKLAKEKKEEIEKQKSLNKTIESELGRLQGNYGHEKQVKQYVATMEARGWKSPAGKDQEDGRKGVIKK